MKPYYFGGLGLSSDLVQVVVFLLGFQNTFQNTVGKQFKILKGQRQIEEKRRVALSTSQLTLLPNEVYFSR